MVDRTRLMEIGNDVASVWGGSCYCFKISPKDKEVQFGCIEHGEKFFTSLSFSEIKEQYGLELGQHQRTQER